jgi:hypothetical protein
VQQLKHMTSKNSFILEPPGNSDKKASTNPTGIQRESNGREKGIYLTGLVLSLTLAELSTLSEKSESRLP